MEPDSEIFSERFHSLNRRLCKPLAGESSLRTGGREFYAKRISKYQYANFMPKIAITLSI
jgi:hypothetical protein